MRKGTVVFSENRGRLFFLSTLVLSHFSLWHRVCVCVSMFVQQRVCVGGAVQLRVVNLVKHELARDGRLGAVYRGGASLKRRNHLLHHFIEEDVS